MIRQANKLYIMWVAPICIDNIFLPSLVASLEGGGGLGISSPWRAAATV